MAVAVVMKKLELDGNTTMLETYASITSRNFILKNDYCPKLQIKLYTINIQIKMMKIKWLLLINQNVFG